MSDVFDALGDFYDLITEGKPLPFDTWKSVDNLLTKGVHLVAAGVASLLAEIPPLAFVVGLLIEIAGGAFVHWLWSFVPHKMPPRYTAAEFRLYTKQLLNGERLLESRQKFLEAAQEKYNQLHPTAPLLEIKPMEPKVEDIKPEVRFADLDTILPQAPVKWLDETVTTVGILNYPKRDRIYASNPGRQATKKLINPTIGRAGF